MILDARNGALGYQCYDAKRCRMVRQVVWVDSDSAQWGTYSYNHETRELRTVATQEDKITIYLDRRLVVFNEVDDSEDCGGAAQPALRAHNEH